MAITWLIDSNDMMATYGVGVSTSNGIIGRPKPKAPVTVSWETMNGNAVDLSKRYYDARDIELHCFIMASSKGAWLAKCNAFVAVFDQPGTRRLAVKVDNNEPLLFEVYASDEMDISREWNDATMVGTFTLKLKEQEPLKRIYKYTRTSTADKTASITITSSKLVSIYWGDGAHTFDAGGTAQTYTHDYTTNGTYYIIVAGNIDEITSLTCNGTQIWSKL